MALNIKIKYFFIILLSVYSLGCNDFSQEKENKSSEILLKVLGLSKMEAFLIWDVVKNAVLITFYLKNQELEFLVWEFLI